MEAEKILCCANPNDNALTMAALNNGGFGNNPMQWLVWLYAMRWLGYDGNKEGDNYNSRSLAQIQDTLNSNQNSNLLMDAVKGNASAINSLAMATNTSFASVNQAVCGVRAAIEQVGGAVGMSAERVINAANLGDMNIVQQLKDCCCSQKMLVQQMGYEGQLRDQANTAAITSRIEQLANGIQSGFAQVGYAAQANTQAIINSQTANTQRILDTLCANQTQSLRDELAEKDRQLLAANIIAGVKNNCSC